MVLRVLSLLAAAVLVGSLAGCGLQPSEQPGQPAPAAGPIPDADEVSAVVIRVEGGPGNESRFPGAPFKLRLTERADIAEVIGWLKEVDWSREGKDLKAIRLGLGGSIEIEKAEGPSLSLLFTWDGVIHKNQLRRVDTARLQEVIRRHRQGG
jgi:hypothetical protein